MTARLLIREVGQREFAQHNGEFTDDDPNAAYPVGQPPPSCFTGIEKATAEGERLCVEGNVEAFQVWELVTTKQRVWRLEDAA